MSNRSTLADTVFFVVGSPRSGTTLLQAMLSSHSQIAIPPETDFFQEFVSCIGHDESETKVRECLTQWFGSDKWHDQNIDEAEFRRRMENRECSVESLFLTFLEMHSERSGKPIVGEKSPFHVRHLGEILTVFPRARIIHIMRDPRDVVASRLRVPWSKGSYRAVAREWQRIQRLHVHYDEQLSAASYCMIRYESLVSEPERSMRDLCAFLGLEFEPCMLTPENRTEPGYSPRESEWKSKSLEGIDRDRVGGFDRRLSPRQVYGVERICRQGMRDLGYEPVMSSRFGWLWGLTLIWDAITETLTRLGRSISKRIGGKRERV